MKHPASLRPGRPRARRLAAAPLVLAAALWPTGGCGITVARDLSSVKPAEVVFDDLCGLAPWFQQLTNNHTLVPARISSTDIERGEGGQALGGQETWRFEPGPARDELLRLLGANWKALPPELGKAKRIDLEVTWARKMAVKRAVTDRPATLILDGKGHSLPYHVCLSDFLYGEPLYKLRGQL